MALEVTMEVGAKKVFATAVDWPGWSRSGRDEAAALESLAGYAERYAPVAEQAGVAFRPTLRSITVVERVPGGGATEFGVPHKVTRHDHEPLTAGQARRRAALVAAAWSVFERVVAGAPATLRKGPRGGGRDRDPIVEHVLGAESAYARKLGIKLPAPASFAAAEALHAEILAVLGRAGTGEPPVPKGWPPRYAAARIAWHVLDHAWEIQDKS
ncbi:MAG: hypothetical protein J2P15_01385 [Micromonosporaceae bacterium]|nr:hypothetical protein [Micromonosporaceae bacterium]